MPRSDRELELTLALWIAANEAKDQRIQQLEAQCAKLQSRLALTARHKRPRVVDAPLSDWEASSREATTGESVIRKYSGDKKSIEARSNDNGRTWSVKLFDNGRLTEYSGGTLAEVDALAAKHGMKLIR